MSMKRISWRIIPIALFIALGAFFWRGLYLDPHSLPSVQVGRALPAFKLAQLTDPKHHFSSKALKHQVALLNIWASWCEPCAQEQVVLMQLAREGVAIYGINYKDSPRNALPWLTRWGNPYRKIGQDKDGKVAIDLGVYGTPETFLIDKQGRIRYRLVGELSQEVWANQLYPLMKQLEQET